MSLLSFMKLKKTEGVTLSSRELNEGEVHVVARTEGVRHEDFVVQVGDKAIPGKEIGVSAHLAPTEKTGKRPHSAEAGTSSKRVKRSAKGPYRKGKSSGPRLIDESDEEIGGGVNTAPVAGSVDGDGNGSSFVKNLEDSLRDPMDHAETIHDSQDREDVEGSPLMPTKDSGMSGLAGQVPVSPMKDPGAGDSAEHVGTLPMKDSGRTGKNVPEVTSSASGEKAGPSITEPEGKWVPEWLLKRGDNFTSIENCRDFIQYGPPLGEVFRNQQYNDHQQSDRLHSQGALFFGTLQDVLSRYDRTLDRMDKKDRRVKKYKEKFIKQNEINLALGEKVQRYRENRRKAEGVHRKTINELGDERIKVVKLESEVRAKDEMVEGLTGRVAELEKLLEEKDRCCADLENRRECEEVRARAELTRLTDDRDQLVRTYDERLQAARDERKWLIEEGMGMVVKKLLRSAEFMGSVAHIQNAVWTAGVHEGLVAGYEECRDMRSIADSIHFKPDAMSDLEARAGAFDAVEYPFLRTVASSSDMGIDDLKKLEPAPAPSGAPES